MKAVIYVRVSTTEQYLDGFSLPAQTSLLKAYAETYGHTIVGIYDDPGISGKNIEDRPGLLKLLADAQQGKFELVLIWKLSRLSRSLLDLLNVTDLLKKHNVSLVSHSEHFDTSTPIGKMLLQLLGSIAEFERNTLIENVRMGMNQRFISGLSKSSIPFGYIHTEDKKITTDVEKAALVKEIFRRFNEGEKISAIVDYLNASGCKNRVGGIWRQEVVSKMLQNEFYLGYVTTGRKDLKDSIYEKKMGVHEPIIDEVLYETVQKRLHATKKQGYVRKPESDQLFSSLVNCPLCGNGMYYVESFRNYADGKKYLTPVYRCGASNPNRKKCSGFSVSKNRVDDKVIDLLREFAYTDELSSLIKENHGRIQSGKTEERLSAIELELQEAFKVRDRYFSLFESGKVEIEHFSDRINSVLEKINTLQKEQNELKAEVKSDKIELSELIEGIKRFFETYDDFDPEERRNILRSFIKNVNLTTLKELHSIDFIDGWTYSK